MTDTGPTIVDHWQPPPAAPRAVYEFPVDPLNWNDTLVQQTWHLPPGTRVLEVGSSTGFFSAALTAQGCEVIGCELDESALAAAQARGMTAWRLDITDPADRAELLARCGGRRFDAVLFGDVLEHLADPAQALLAARELLLPGGRVVASIPNVAHGSVRLDLLRGRFRYQPAGLLDHTHVQLFTLERLHELFATTGYTVEHLSRALAPLEGTEGRVEPGELPAELVQLVATDPESWVYQYIVVARPVGLARTGHPPVDPAAADLVVLCVGDGRDVVDAGAWADAVSGDRRVALIELRTHHEVAAAAAQLPPHTPVVITEAAVQPAAGWVQAMLDAQHRHGSAGVALVGYDHRVVHAGAERTGRALLAGLAVPHPLLDADRPALLRPPYATTAAVAARPADPQLPAGSGPVGMVAGGRWATAPIASPPAADRWARYRRALGSSIVIALPSGPALLAASVRRNLLRLAERAARGGCTLVVHWGDAAVTGHRGCAEALQRAGVVCLGGNRAVDRCGADPDLRYLDPLIVAEQLDTLVFIDARDAAAGDAHPCQLNVDLAAIDDELLDAIERLCRAHGSSPATEAARALVVVPNRAVGELEAACAAVAAAGLEPIIAEVSSAAAVADALDALQQADRSVDLVVLVSDSLTVWPSSLDVPLVRWATGPATAQRRSSVHDDLICVAHTDGLAALAVRRPHLRLAPVQAASAAMAALLDDGSCARSRFRLGTRHLERGAVVAATEQFLAAARLDPGAPQAYNGLGMCSFAQGDLPAARRAFGAAVRIAPAYEPALANLAAVAPQPADHGPQRPAATIVIPVWNAWEHTRECLLRLVSTIEAGDHVVVVDNGSTDGTAAGLEEFPWVQVERVARNLGFASGCNIGAAAATGEVVVFLNNDTIPTQDWLDRLLRPFHDGDVVATGPRSNFVSGVQCVHGTSYLGGAGAALDAFVRRWQADHDSTAEAVDRLVGFCLAVRREAFFAVGAFDERFGIGGYEDDDLCRRLREDGGTLLMVHDSFVHHHGHATFDANGVDWAALERHNRELYRAKSAA